MSFSEPSTFDRDETYEELLGTPAQRRNISFHVIGNPTFVNVHKAVQYNSGYASGSQGYLTMMSDNDNDPNKHLAPPEGDQDLRLLNGSKTPSRPPTPANYIEQQPDWFKPGRFFSIWAPYDLEIHNKKFVLLDTKNIEGQGVLVETRDKDGLKQLEHSSSAFRTVMALRDPKSCEIHTHTSSGRTASSGMNGTYAPPALPSNKNSKDAEIIRALDKKFKSVYLDDCGHQHVPPGTYIFLEHTYNIPFVKYKCVDHGMVDAEYLDDLRFHYVEHLVNNWRLTSRAKQRYG